MANIQPYQYQKRTNIEEHNDLVSKINEIIDVINQTNIETILPKINKLEADVSAINDTDNVQNTDIANLKDKDVQIDNRLSLNESNIDGITKSLVSDVVLMNGTTTGNMKARIGRENAPSIDSNDYNIQKPVSVELVQGSASAMVKAKITLSDGTVLISDDFMFTTEAIGTDVYISSFTFKNGNVAGTISADIGLSNGSTLEANNFVVPTDPNVISSISDLQSRMTAVENGSIGGLDELKATVDGHTTSINKLNTDVASLKTDKADVNNNNQTIIAGTINATNINKNGVEVATTNDIPDISGKVNIAQGTANAGKVLSVGEDGNVIPTVISTGGIEKIDLNNWPTDWAEGDIIFITLHCYIKSTATSWQDSTKSVLSINNNDFNPWPFGKGAFSWIAGGTSNTYLTFPIESVDYAKAFIGISFPGLTAFNRTSSTLCYISAHGFNGATGNLGVSGGDIVINSPSQLANYVTSIYRIKAS